jgi:hypothetical protein
MPKTYRLHGDPETPATGATVVGHLYPTVGFAWIVRTGSAVNRQALAAAVASLDARLVLGRAVLAVRARWPHEDYQQRPAYVTPARVRRLQRATAQALRTRYALHGDMPKGDHRVETEAHVIATILRLGATALATTPAPATEAR